MSIISNSGLVQCYDVMSMLQAQLRTAQRIREQLESGSPDEAALSDFCEEMLENAIETARVIADLEDTVCPNGRPHSPALAR